MSVSFYLDSSKVNRTWQLACGCGQTRLATSFAEYADAQLAQITGALPTCEDEYCAAYNTQGYVSAEATELDAFDINMANTNAVRVLETLGVVGDDCYAGSLDAEAFLGRVMLAQAINPADEGVATVREGNMVYCGRAEGYIDEKLAMLRDLAEQGVARQLAIVWS